MQITMCLCKWEEEIQKLDFVEGEMVLLYYFPASQSF
jgi:hypothetical protein